MAYFLKVSKQQSRTYLSIYESFYSPDVKGTKHRSVINLGNIDKLIASGIDDPIAYYKEEVKKMNAQRKQEKASQKAEPLLIQESSPEKFLGYVPLSSVLNTLDVQEHFDHMQSTRRFHFNVFDVFSSLVFARAVFPASKYRTFHDILPSLLKSSPFSYDQLLAALEFMGSEYEKFVEILTTATHENYGIDTSNSFFDCTNFYFEIDKETDFKRKGPSKENRKDPIIGLGLLLDANMIPIGMKMYPGNESEKPVMRDIISSLKRKNNISGKTIQIADKGLNCARNIIEAVGSGDGYIFSKSVKSLPEKEKKWAFNTADYQDVLDRNGDVVYSYKYCVDEFEYSYKDEDGRLYKKTVKEKRICTFNPKLQRKKLMEINRMIEKAKKMRECQAKKEEYGESARYVKFTDENGKKAKVIMNEAYQAYHQLWRIEETFRVMKSELDARPVFMQKEDTIKGHFLICYAATLLERIFQFKVLDDAWSTTEICRFIKEFKVVKISEHKYINVTRSSPLITYLSHTFNLPFDNYYLSDKQIKMMHTR